MKRSAAQAGMQRVCELGGGPRPSLSERYLLYLPDGYKPQPDKRWPLILFLHGAGERGDAIELVETHGIPRRLATGASLPFIVVSPHCPAGERWDATSLGALLDEVERKFSIDSDRVYVTGMSMGGTGAWGLALAQPRRFAAIAPVCGRGDPSSACTIAHLPAWVFHGACDDVVPLQRSEEMVEALRECGGAVRFTVYPEAGHDSWTQTYENPDLYTWLLSNWKSATGGQA